LKKRIEYGHLKKAFQKCKDVNKMSLTATASSIAMKEIVFENFRVEGHILKKRLITSKLGFCDTFRNVVSN